MNKQSIYETFFSPEVNDFCKNGGYESLTALYKCVQAGNLDGLPKVMDAYLRLLRPHIGINFEYSKYVSLYIFAQLQEAATHEGISLENCRSIQEEYYSALDSAANIDQVLLAISNQCFDLTYLIHKIKTEHGYSSVVLDCCTYIRANLHEQISVADIAQYVHLSPSYISSKFKQETGLSLLQYIRREKIQEAKALLKSDMSLMDIAMDLGFTTQGQFTESFKKECGMTPTEFKKYKKI